jgi:hypothetical protein
MNQLASGDMKDGFGAMMFIILAFNFGVTRMGMAMNVTYYELR